MGIFSKAARKLHLKEDPERDAAKAARKAEKAERKHYRSQHVATEGRNVDEVGAARLYVEQSPFKPGGIFGGKGLSAGDAIELNNPFARHHKAHAQNGVSAASAAGSSAAASAAAAAHADGLGGLKAAADIAPAKAAMDELGAVDDHATPSTSGAAAAAPARPIGPAAHAPVTPELTPVAGKTVHMLQVFQWLLVGYVLFILLVFKLAEPSLWRILSTALCTAPLGLAYSWAFYYNKRKKAEIRSQLNVEPGLKGLRAMLGDLPNWIAFQDKEKVDWMNRVLAELWPFYDKAVAAAVRDTVEPLMEQYKPPGLIKAIYFKDLTFGEAPFKIESVWVENEGENHVLMECDFRWAGQANIAIAIELPAGGDLTRMVPKVSNLQVAGTMRVVFSPLVPEIPGFGAVVIALRKPPIIHFQLDFGKAFGGAASAKAVRLWLDPFLRDTLSNLLVWPNRIVVPILPESITGPLDHLELRHVGVLQVTIVQATGLKKMDTFGKSDPFVELYTRPDRVERTTVKKHTLEPVWNERCWLMVDEPKTQFMRVQMYDKDAIHVKDLLQINVVGAVKQSFVDAKSHMGRCAVGLREFAAAPGQEIDKWYDLGKGSWANEDGCGSGEGRLHLRVVYMPFEMLYTRPPTRASKGAVLVTLKKAEDLAAADDNGFSDPYCKLTIGKVTRKSTFKPVTLNPVWNEKFDWYDVPVESELKVEVFDRDAVSGDEYLGMAEVDIWAEVAQAPQGEVLKTWWLEEVPADPKLRAVPPSSITMHVQWVPFNFEG